MSYAAGFADGERDAYKDRANAIRRTVEAGAYGYAQGYSDGYRPRSPEWSARPPIDSAAWWVEREALSA